MEGQTWCLAAALACSLIWASKLLCIPNISDLAIIWAVSPISVRCNSSSLCLVTLWSLCGKRHNQEHSKIEERYYAFQRRGSSTLKSLLIINSYPYFCKLFKNPQIIQNSKSTNKKINPIKKKVHNQALWCSSENQQYHSVNHQRIYQTFSKNHKHNDSSYMICIQNLLRKRVDTVDANMEP